MNYSESFLEFLKSSDCKIANILVSLNSKRYKSLMLTDDIDYLTNRIDGSISYLPKGKEHIVNEDGTWNRVNRQNGKPAKVIRKLFTDRALKLFKDSDFECFANMYKSAFNDEGYVFEELPNTEIINVYCADILSGDGTLNSSCMNGNLEYLDIYVNCKQLSILTLKDKDGLLCGRALLWNFEADSVFMDRIYVVKDFMYELFLDYCSKKGYWRKENYKTYNYKNSWVNPYGIIEDKYVRIYTETNYYPFPYIDTFSYGEDGYLTNEETYKYLYTCTNGERYSVHINGEWHLEDDCVYINGEYYLKDDCVYINGEYHLKEDCVEINDEYYLEDDCVYINGEYHLEDDCVYINGEYYLKDDCVYINDEWHLEDDCVYINGEYYLKEDCVEINDEYYLEDDCVEINGEWTIKLNENA